MSKFRTGTQGNPNVLSANFAEVSLLPDAQKQSMCINLLQEFGCTNISRINANGEIIHSCILPFGGHKNGDLNPSASLNYQKLTFNCWGCGNSGGLLWFIGVCRGTSSEDARSWLKSETGTGGEEQNLASLLEYFDAIWSPARVQHSPIPHLDFSVLQPWLAIHPYMTEQRGIPVDNLKHFLVGYNPTTRVPFQSSWKMSERIIIPHFWKGVLTGWQSRRIFNDGTAKYISSPDLPKDSTIYNYRRYSAVVVESPMSVISKWHVAPNLEATFGASVTDRQIKLLAEHNKVILFFDNDEAGWGATRKVGDALMPYTNVLVADNSYDADVADLSDSVLTDMLEHPIPYSLWNPPKDLIPWQA